MDFPDYMDSGDVLAEFSLKYKGSNVLINNIFCRIIEINTDAIYTDGGAFELKANHTIKRLILKSGLYKNSNSIIYIAKLAKRQWCKGVLFGETHIIKPLVGLIAKNIDSYTYEGNHTLFNVEDKQLFFIFTKCVGTSYNGCELIVNKDSEYLLNEIKELWKQYKVLTDSNYQKSTVGSLKQAFLQELRLN